MFKWFTSKGESGRAGLERMRAEFGQMLDAGRHVFDTAANTFLGGTDPEVIRKDLFKTDKRINRAERQIRREIVVHASVHGTTDFPACLVLMSIVKDAERVGDYGKNLFDLAELAPQRPEGEHREGLVALKDRILRLMAGCREVFDTEEQEVATRLIVEAKGIEDLCDERVQTLVRGNDAGKMAPAYVLAYRYFKRVTSHVRNIASSVVQPVHKLDFTSKITVEEPTEEQ
jgi:phosphate uptake regulator